MLGGVTWQSRVRLMTKSQRRELAKGYLRCRETNSKVLSGEYTWIGQGSQKKFAFGKALPTA